MSIETIVFVHGTGVRLKGCKERFDRAGVSARRAGVKAAFEECIGGDAFGIEFEGLSLPGAPSQQQIDREGEDFTRWSWPFYDPLFELAKLTIRTDRKDDSCGGKPQGLVM
jgi:hypothetical protein